LLLLVLEPPDYQRALTRLRENVLRVRAGLLRRVFVFSIWQDDDLRRLAEAVSERHFNPGVTIVQQGKRVLDSMFFLVRGECRVLRQVDVSAVQQEMLAVTSDLIGGKAEIGQLTPRGAADKTMSPLLLEVQQPFKKKAWSGGSRWGLLESVRRASCLTLFSSTATRKEYGGGRKVDLHLCTRVIMTSFICPHAHGPSRRPARPHLLLSPRSSPQVGSLKSHEHPFFGENAMADRGVPPVYSTSILTSTPVLCLCLSKYDFVHQIDAATQALIFGFASTQDLDDRAIRASIAKTYLWEVEKRKALGHVIAESAERRRLESPRLNGRMEPNFKALTPRTGRAR
jgi:hypothetical protein